MMDAAIGIGANLHCLSALAPVHDDGLGHLVTRLLRGCSFEAVPLTFAFLISNSTY
jgi:hypothetical protein